MAVAPLMPNFLAGIAVGAGSILVLLHTFPNIYKQFDLHSNLEAFSCRFHGSFHDCVWVFSANSAAP